MKCLVSLVRLVPDPIRTEHINLGVILQDAEGNFAVDIPDTVNNTKVPRWYRALDSVLINEFLRDLKATAQEHLKEDDLRSLSARYQMGMITITTPKAIGMTAGLDATCERLVDRYIDLRPTRGGSRFQSAGVVRGKMRRLFEREGLLNTKVEQDPTPVRPNPHAPPACMDFRWLNGRDQYLKVFSTDKADEPGTKAVYNAWDAGKALLIDCETVLEGDRGISVVLQQPRVDSEELKSIAETITGRLERLHVPVYSPEDLDELLLAVRNGRELSLGSAP